MHYCLYKTKNRMRCRWDVVGWILKHVGEKESKKRNIYKRKHLKDFTIFFLNPTKSKVLFCDRTWVNSVVKVFPVIEPDFGKACVISVDHVGRSTWKAVGRRLAEHMADPRTSRNLQATTTHPYLTHIDQAL